MADQGDVSEPGESGVVIDCIDWDLRREMATAPRDAKHFGGVARCLQCAQERRVVVRAPGWAFAPLPVECSSCGGWALLVDPSVPVVEGAKQQEPYFLIVVPAPDGPGSQA
jgi:hypothetical protein